MGEKGFQKSSLVSGQYHGSVMDVQGIGLAIQQKTRAFQHMGASFIAFQHISRSRQQTFLPAGLCQIFIRTQFQDMKLITHLIAGSQHQYRDRTFLLYFTADLKAACLRKIDVQKDQIRR